MPPHISPCDDIIVLKEKVAALEAWRISTEAELKEIRETISQVRMGIELAFFMCGNLHQVT